MNAYSLFRPNAPAGREHQALGHAVAARTLPDAGAPAGAGAHDEIDPAALDAALVNTLPRRQAFTSRRRRVTMPRRYVIAFAGVSDALADACALALAALGRLRPLRAITTEALSDSSIALVELADPMPASIERFGRIRRCNPAIPIVLIGKPLHPEVAVELIKCGADDYLALPLRPEALARKVARCVHERYGPVFDIPGLELLFPKQRSFDGVNHRRAFRALVPKSLSASARLAGAHSSYGFAIRDVSLAADDAPGGMRLTADAVTAAELGVGEWQVGKHLELSAQLDEGTAIALVATVVRPPLMGQERSLTLGVVYTPVHRSDASRIQRFWYECQRRGDTTHT